MLYERVRERQRQRQRETERDRETEKDRDRERGEVGEREREVELCLACRSVLLVAIRRRGRFPADCNDDLYCTTAFVQGTGVSICVLDKKSRRRKRSLLNTRQ